MLRSRPAIYECLRFLQQGCWRCNIAISGNCRIMLHNSNFQDDDSFFIIIIIKEDAASRPALFITSYSSINPFQWQRRHNVTHSPEGHPSEYWQRPALLNFSIEWWWTLLFCNYFSLERENIYLNENIFLAPFKNSCSSNLRRVSDGWSGRMSSTQIFKECNVAWSIWREVLRCFAERLSFWSKHVVEI